MKRFQMEKLYEVNGLTDYRLKRPTDLIVTHGIDYIKVDGFNQLSNDNKALFGSFIVNFFNGLGLESRMTLIPKSVYLAEDYDILVKENPEDDYFNVAGGVVLKTHENGVKTVHKTWSDEDYTHIEPKTEGRHKTYLRFEYEHDGREEWLHVMSPKEWY